MQVHWCISSCWFGLDRPRENYSCKALLWRGKRMGANVTPPDMAVKRIEETRDNLLLFLQFSFLIVLQYGTVRHSPALAVWLALVWATARSLFSLYQMFSSLRMQVSPLQRNLDRSPCWEHVCMHVHVCDSTHAVRIPDHVHLLPRETHRCK